MSALSPHDPRPRERLLRHSASTLTTAELLGIVMRTGLPGCNAVQLGQRLLDHCHGIQGLLSADAQTLLSIPGIGTAKCCEILAVAELHRRVNLEAMSNKVLLNRPELVKNYCIAYLGPLAIEHCLALFLDTQFQLLNTEEVAKGTLNQASIYPREIAKAAIRHHAAAIILAHNHPSGVCFPSQSDLRLTQHLKQALALIDVQLVDHLIVTQQHAYSMAEHQQI